MTDPAVGRAQPAGLSLRRNAAWMLLGQGGYAVGQWLTVIILAQLGGPAPVGQFTLALAVTSPIIVFSQLQMRTILVVDAAGRYPFIDYLAVRLAATAPALLVITAVATLGGYPASVAAAILVLGLARAVESLSDIYYGLAQRHGRLDRVAQSMLLRSAIGCAALGLMFTLTGSLVGALTAQAATWAAVWWLFDRHLTLLRRGEAAPCPTAAADSAALLRRRLRLAWTGLPLGSALLLTTLNVNVPRYAVEGFMDLEALGVFGAITHFVFAGRPAIDAVCQAASPRLAKLFAQGDITGFRRLLLRLLGIGLLLGLAGVLVAWLFGATLLDLVYGPAFADHAGLFVFAMALGLVDYTVVPFGYGLTAMQCFRVAPAVHGFALVINVLACLLLVPRYGLAGAIGSWFLAVACQGLINLILNTRYLHQAAKGRQATGTLTEQQDVAAVSRRPS